MSFTGIQIGWTEMHRHKCPRCLYVWQHSDATAYLTTPDQFDLAHTCPNCELQDVTEKCNSFRETCALSLPVDSPLAEYQRRLEKILEIAA